MNKKITAYTLFFTSFLVCQVGVLDFAKKYEEWRLGNPNNITYTEFENLLHDAQASPIGLHNLMLFINLPDFEINKVFSYTEPSGTQRLTTPLILALLAKLPSIVDRLLARGASLNLQSGWRTPFDSILLTKENVIKSVVQKSRGLTGTMTENDFMYFTTHLTDQERAEIDQLAPAVLDAKIKEYLPVMNVIENYARERKDAQISQAIAGYRQKFQFITGGVKSAYSAGATS